MMLDLQSLLSALCSGLETIVELGWSRNSVRHTLHTSSIPNARSCALADWAEPM